MSASAKWAVPPLALALTSIPAATATGDDRDALASWLNERVMQQADRYAASMRSGTVKEPGSYTLTPIDELDAPEVVKPQLRGVIPDANAGRVRVSPLKMPRVDEILARIPACKVSDAVLAERLPFPASAVQHTALGNYTLIGMESSGAIHGVKSTGLSRYYLGERGLIEFNETHYHAGGTKIEAFADSMNIIINGRPAQSVVELSEDGRGRAALFWVSAQKAFTLTLLSDEGAAIEESLQRLIAIAKKITD